VRLGILTWDFHPAKGGQGRHTFELWRRLYGRAGLDVNVFSPSKNDLPGRIPVGRLAEKGRGPGFSISAAWNQRRWAKANAIDLWQINGGPGGVLLGPLTPRNSVYVAHHTYEQQARLVPGQGWKSPLAVAEAAGYARASRVIAVSPSTRESVRRENAYAAERTTIIPNGVDTDLFQPQETEKERGSILFVGRLDARKGFAFLIRAWALVSLRRADAHLYVIGRGPAAIPAQRFLARRRLEQHVTFVGQVSDDGLPHWYNRAVAVAVPSVFEGFGLTALEALACGTPVVATDSDGLRDVVRPGCDGYLTPYGDVEALAETLLRVLDEEPHVPLKRIREIRAAHDWDRIAEEYARVYEEVLP
jgi:glycosyltransferase involved in cell wall biosynthesis